MPDLREKLAAWRRPFEASVIYRDEDLDELEDHLLSLVEEGASEGRHLGDAWNDAVATVGDESRLRPTFLKRWKERSWASRWWARIRQEGRASSRPRVYRLLRVGSLLAGGLGVLGLFSKLATLHHVGLGSWYWWEGAYFHLQGTWFLWSLAAISFFNLVPYRRWSGSVGDWLRAGFSGWLLAMAMRNVILAAADNFTMPADALEPHWWSLVLGIGPILWALQLRWRTRETEPKRLIA